MATKQDFDSLVSAIDAETNRIAAKIDELNAQSQRTDLTAEEETAVHTAFSGVADRLRLVGANPAQPIPPVEPSTPDPSAPSGRPR